MKKIIIILMALPLFLFEMPAVPMEAASVQGSDVTPVDISKGEKILVAKLNKTKGSGRLLILDSLTELYWNVPEKSIG